MSNRAAAKGLLRDYDGAIDDATRALRLKPDHVPALVNRAVARERRGDMPAAIEDYTSAIKLRPDDQALHFKRGSALLSMGRAGRRPQPKLLMQARGDFAKVLEAEGPYRPQAEMALKEIQAALSN
jgi:tetratricopeptide (TPR) repeat protein